MRIFIVILAFGFKKKKTDQSLSFPPDSTFKNFPAEEICINIVRKIDLPFLLTKSNKELKPKEQREKTKIGLI